MKDAHTDATIKRLALREAQICQSLPPHTNVARLTDAFRGTSGRVYLVFELCERSLLQEIRKRPRGVLPPDMAKVVAWQLLRALEHCHKQGVVHRDVKPANVLLGVSSPAPPASAAGVTAAAAACAAQHGDGSAPRGAGIVVKLCDFGLARNLPKRSGAAELPPAGGVGGQQDDREHRLGGLTDYVVTRWYRAPEVIISCEPYDTAVDIWSFGCTLAELMSGTPLFPGSSSPDQLWRIMRCCGALADRHAAYLRAYPRLAALAETPPPGRTLAQRVPAACPQMLDLISACLNMDPLKRPTATQLLQHPFFADVPRLLAADPELQQLLAAPQPALPQPLVPSALQSTPATAAADQTNQQQLRHLHADTAAAASTAAAPTPEAATAAAAQAHAASLPTQKAGPLAAVVPASEMAAVAESRSQGRSMGTAVGSASSAAAACPPPRVLPLSVLIAAVAAAPAEPMPAADAPAGVDAACNRASAAGASGGGGTGTGTGTGTGIGTGSRMAAWPHAQRLPESDGAATRPHVVPVDLGLAYLVDFGVAMLPQPAAGGGIVRSRLRDVGSEQLIPSSHQVLPVALEQRQQRRRHTSYPRLPPNLLQVLSSTEGQPNRAATETSAAFQDAVGLAGQPQQGRSHGTVRHGILAEARSAPVPEEEPDAAAAAATTSTSKAASSSAALQPPAPLLPVSPTLARAPSASPLCSWSQLRQSATPSGAPPTHCPDGGAQRQAHRRLADGHDPPRAPDGRTQQQLRPPALAARRMLLSSGQVGLEAYAAEAAAAAAASASSEVHTGELPSQLASDRLRDSSASSGGPYAYSPAVAVHSSRKSAITAAGSAGALHQSPSLGQGQHTGSTALYHGPSRLPEFSSGITQYSPHEEAAGDPGPTHGVFVVSDRWAAGRSGGGIDVEQQQQQQQSGQQQQQQRPALHDFVCAAHDTADVEESAGPAAAAAAAGECGSQGGGGHAAASPVIAVVSSVAAAAAAAVAPADLPGAAGGLLHGLQRPGGSVKTTADAHEGDIEVTVSVRMAAATLLTAAVTASSICSRGSATNLSLAPCPLTGSGAAAVDAAAAGPAGGNMSAAATSSHVRAGLAAVAAVSAEPVQAAPNPQQPAAAADAHVCFANGPVALVVDAIARSGCLHDLRSPSDGAAAEASAPRPEPRNSTAASGAMLAVARIARGGGSRSGSGCRSCSIFGASGDGGGHTSRPTHGPVAGIINVNALLSGGQHIGGAAGSLYSSTCASVDSCCATPSYAQRGNGSATPIALAGPPPSAAASSFSTYGGSVTTAGAAAGTVHCSSNRGGPCVGSSTNIAVLELLSSSAGVPLATASYPASGACGAVIRVSGGGVATAVSAAMQLRGSAHPSAPPAAGASAAPDDNANARRAAEAEAATTSASAGVELEASTMVRSRVHERLLAQASSRLSGVDKDEYTRAKSGCCRRSGSRDGSLSASVAALWWKGFTPRPAILDMPGAQALFSLPCHAEPSPRPQPMEAAQAAAAAAAHAVCHSEDAHVAHGSSRCGRGTTGTWQVSAESVQWYAAAKEGHAPSCAPAAAAAQPPRRSSLWQALLAGTCWRG